MGEIGQNDSKQQATGLILIVEDEFLIAMELETVLIDAGHRVLGPAASVRTALGLLDGLPPDAAILDVNLGRERVTPVAEALASRGIPFVLASAYLPGDLANEPVLSRAENLGKPTRAGDLLASLGRLLSGRPNGRS